MPNLWRSAQAASRLGGALWRIMVVCILWTVSLVHGARAQGAGEKDVGYLSEQLRSGPDFRVRTQAALALGVSGDAGAGAPLCRALDDASESIRSAAAAALGRLGRAENLGCLRKQLAQEKSGAVRSIVERSIRTLSAVGEGPRKATPGPSDRYYVAIGATTDKTGRTDGSVAKLVEATIEARLAALNGFAIAPAAQGAAAAQAVLKKHNLKGYFLQTRVEASAGSSGGLVVQVRMTLWTYPSKALQAEFSPRLTSSGGALGDQAAEDRLIRMAVERAVDSFAQVASSAAR